MFDKKKKKSPCSSALGLGCRGSMFRSPAHTLPLELVLQILMIWPGFASGASLRRLPREQARSFYQRMPHPSLPAPFDPAAPPQTCEPLVNATFNLLITAFALWYEDRSLNWQRSLRAELHAVQGQLGLFQLCQGGRVSPSLRPPIDEGITFSI